MDEARNTRARKTCPLEAGELDAVRREYVPKPLSPEEKEAIRLVCGRSLYSAYLNENEQSAYTDKIIKLAPAQTDNPVIRLFKRCLNSFFLRQDVRFNELKTLSPNPLVHEANGFGGFSF